MKFDFAANKTVDSIDKVPTDFRGLYADDGDGSFTLRSDDPGVQSAVAAITRMSGALTAARSEAKTAKESGGVDLSPLADYGEDPATIAQAVNAKLEELQTQLAAGKNKKSADEVQAAIERMKTDLMADHTKQLEAKEGINSSLKSQLHKVLVSDQATREIVAAGGDPELLMPFIAPKLKPIEHEGEYHVRVVDENGEVRYSGATGDTMTIGEVVGEIKGQEKFQRFFSSDAPSGGGTPPGSNRRSPQLPKQAEMTPNQKIASGLARGLAQKAGSGDRAGAGVHG